MKISLTRDDLVHIASRPKNSAQAKVWDAYVAALMSAEASRLFDRYQINTPRRMQHLLATMVCESNLSIIWESGAYSASRILDIFGADHHTSAITPAEAKQISSLPVNADGSGPRCEALFERAYGYKTTIGLKMGNTAPGDGWKHRGLGLNQQTGKASQQRAAAKVGCSLDDLQKPINLIHMALTEWEEKNCNKYADNDDAVSIRKLINGGSLKVSISKINGLPQAQAALRLAKNVITAADFSDTAVADAADPAPANENKPVSLMASTEMQAAGIVGTGGAVQMQQSLANAAAQTAAGGRFSLGSFLMHLMADPLFWLTVVTIAGAVYMAIKRRKRFHIFGV